ncbi:MAG TPA: replicative DNA helicase [Candidatus Binataceae bacterium]|nr:replicative DNA helicase [Candidatus Binataceae bacterium]
MADGADDILRRVPPQNLEAEQCVLGAILLDNDAINHALEIIVAEDFYRDSHRDIFRGMVDLTERNTPVDAITLAEALRVRGTLERIGGAAYIAELASIVPTAAHVVHYARLIRDRSVLRSLASTATEITTAAFESQGNVDEFLDEAEHRIFEIAERRIKPSFHSMSEVARSSIALMERLYERKELVTGVPSGFLDLDRITAGFQKSDLAIIAARPSMGKSALALNIAAHAAVYADPPVGVAFFSLEMSKEQLGLRMLCSDARVDSAKVRTGYLRAQDFPKLIEAADRLSMANIFIDDSSDVSPLQLKAKCRRLKRDKSANLGLIIVDYLQLMRSSRPGESREKEISEVSRSLKGLAKELNIPVIALSQLNRQVEMRDKGNRRPILADLRESGAIEQDADVIAFIYRDEVYNKDTKEPGVAEIIVSKQRNGPTDTAKLTYLGQYTRFENYTPDTGAFEDTGG